MRPITYGEKSCRLSRRMLHSHCWLLTNGSRTERGPYAGCRGEGGESGLGLWLGVVLAIIIYNPNPTIEVAGGPTIALRSLVIKSKRPQHSAIIMYNPNPTIGVAGGPKQRTAPYGGLRQGTAA
jgi:hypothetical protein